MQISRSGELGGFERADATASTPGRQIVVARLHSYPSIEEETLRRSFEYIVVSWWMVGVVLQIGAGLTGRIRLARTTR